MSVQVEDCQYRGGRVSEHDSRRDALEAAHDYLADQYVVEYGVIEMNAIPEEYCGQCWVCVYERNIRHPDLTICNACGQVISHSEGMVGVASGWYHSRCEPRLSNLEI
jgi:hypothetical protein